MLTENQIIQFIETNNAPYWKLYAVKRWDSRELVGQYDCNDIDKEAPEADKVKASQLYLQSLLNNWLSVGMSEQFKIVLRRTNTSNQNLFEYNFSLNGASQQPAPVQNSGLAGIPQQTQDFATLGYVPKTYVETMLEQQRQRNLLDMEKALFERDKRDFSERQKEAKSELNGAFQKYNDNSEAIKNGLGMLIGEIIKGITGSGTLANLAGSGITNHLSQQQPEQQPEQVDPRAKIVEQIASELYNEIQNESDLVAVQNVIRNKLLTRYKNDISKKETSTAEN